MPSLGRPIKGKTRRDNKLTVMLTTEEKDMLTECAERKQTARTEVIVEGIRLVKQELDEKK